MRRRMTSRKRTASEPRSILAEIRDVERMIEAVDDEELAKDAQGLANEDEEIVKESTPADVDVPSGDILDENAKAMDNWPTTARRKFAARLLRIADMILAEEEEEECGD